MSILLNQLNRTGNYEKEKRGNVNVQISRIFSTKILLYIFPNYEQSSVPCYANFSNLFQLVILSELWPRFSSISPPSPLSRNRNKSVYISGLYSSEIHVTLTGSHGK